MGCPQCQSDDVSSSGKCLACGYEEPDSSIPIEVEYDTLDSQIHPGMIEEDYPDGEQESAKEDGRPQWRQELSQRLEAIRQKKGTPDISDKPGGADSTVPVPSPSFPSGPTAAVSSNVDHLRTVPVLKPVQRPPSPVPKQKTLQPVAHEPRSEAMPAKETDPVKIREMIDSAISKTSAQPTVPDANSAAHDTVPEELMEYEGKLVFLSRTLSGLVDLIIVILCSGIFIIAADLFSGIIALDGYSYLLFSALFLLMYLFYSLFFLSASGQTIGMMITDLRVVDDFEGRPLFNQILRRCLAYVASVLGLGFGLIWGLLDRENRCFHDRVSDTRVIRI
jgi:uncharacterized RDD family membrane protein YckC